MTLIEGEVFFDRKNDLVMREKLAAEKRALIERERRNPGAAATDSAAACTGAPAMSGG
jgi:hypothetical protein